MRTRIDRGQDKNGKWHFGSVVRRKSFATNPPNTNPHFYLISDEDDGHQIEVKPESVGEWTGQYDYSTPKKRIFEGDILAHIRNPELGMYEVYYNETSAAYFARSVMIERKEEPLTALLACPWWLVCGNTTDNPEYLKYKPCK